MAPCSGFELATGWNRRLGAVVASVGLVSCTCVWAQGGLQQPSSAAAVAAPDAELAQGRPLSPASQLRSGDPQALLRRGRDALGGGDRYAALAAIALRHRLQPNNLEIARALADVLMELGAPGAAADALGAHADLGVRSRVAAERLRWATLIEPRSPDPRRRFDDVDPALAALDALLAESRVAVPVDAGLVTRLECDRAVALRQRERWQEAVDQVNGLRAADVDIPVYVLQVEADSLLALRRPQDAQRVYKEALGKLSPSERDDEEGPWRSLMTGLAYAQEESEDFNAAFASVSALIERAGQPWHAESALQTPRPNDQWLAARSLDAAMHSYADMPAGAWERIEPLAGGAPALPWLRAQAADVEAQRGWPRLAEQDIDIAAAMAPDDFGIRLSQVDSDMRRHRLARADERLAPLIEQGGDLPRVQQVRRELDAAMGPSVRFELGGRDTSGQAVRGPGNGMDARLQVESSTLAGTWRLIGFADGGTDSVEEGRAERRRFGGGAQARWPDWQLVALAWSQSGSLDTSGGSLAAQWGPSDQWTFMADAARHSPDTPLRADLHGITADSVRGGARYAWNESLGAGVQLQQMDFSDGNDRRLMTVDGMLKVLDRPHLDITLRPRIEWQRNSLADTPYFSPSESWLGSVEALIEHVIWRAYEEAFVQRLGLTLGVFEQRNFGRNAIGGVSYEQSWRHDPWTEVSWGVGWTSMVYDGSREQELRAYLKFEHRFGR